MTGATAASISSADFPGTVSSTGNSVATDFATLFPAVGSTLRVNLASGAPLAGQQVHYQYFVPTIGNLQEDLGSQTLNTGTFFTDGAEGITVVIDANTITILNDFAGAFAPGSFNGPNLLFSGVNITKAVIDPISAADFTGSISFTPDSVGINFASMLPALGHAVVIDVSSQPVPEPATIVVFGAALAGAVWRKRKAACRKSSQ